MKNWKELRKNYEILSEVFLNEDDENNEHFLEKDVNEFILDNKNKKNLIIENTTLCSLSSLLSKIKGIKSRDLEMWLPILSIAMTISEDTFNNILELCTKLIREKDTEDVTESTDLVLIDVLADIVDKDDYYNVKMILNRLREHMGFENEKENKWLNNRWVSRALKRLAFNDKRRHGSGVQYRLLPKNVQDISERSGMALERFIKKDKQKSIISENTDD